MQVPIQPLSPPNLQCPWQKCKLPFALFRPMKPPTLAPIYAKSMYLDNFADTLELDMNKL